MHGDFSRPKFVSDRPFTRVTQFQGRVGLDADFNTHALLQHDRDATTRIDVIGESGVPKHGGGFALTPAGATDLTISKGRIYLHGFICELSADTPFTAQPYLPGATLTPPATGVTVVYLEVWELHRTGVDAPEILDPALDGRDTSGRVQTVFQVKAENAPAGTECVIPTTVTAGQGKLSVPKVTPTAAADPCSLDAAGGYRGLDNRLYRVEIHTPDIPANPFGPAVPATFKWSRDNGAVEYALKAAPTLAAGQVKATLRVPPRDDVLALHAGQWVELLDDETVYRSESGPLLKIAEEPTRTPDGVELTLAAAGVASVPGGTHPRVRRWDGAIGADAVQAEVLLEDDIKIQFGGSAFRTGDYWTFTARANGNAVDELLNASPHGILRHRTPLGVITWSGGAISGITDCRKPFPPLTELPTPTAGNTGCCTLTAHDVPSLFKAVSQANDANGPVRVCVLPGVYELVDPLVIRRRSTTGPLILTGCGQATHITRKSGPAVRVLGAVDVVIDKLTVSGMPAVQVEDGDAGRAGRVMIHTCDLTHPKAEWAILAVGDDLTVSESTCAGGIGIGPSSSDVRVERNTIRGGWFGVAVGELATDPQRPRDPRPARNVAIRENAIRESRSAGVASFGISPTLPDSAGEAVVAVGLSVVGNTVSECGEMGFQKWPAAGVVVGRVADVRIADNTIRDCGRGKGPACGIFAAGVGHLEVSGNTVTGNGVPALVRELNFANPLRFPDRTDPQPVKELNVSIVGFPKAPAAGFTQTRIGAPPNGPPNVRGVYGGHQLAFNFPDDARPEFVALTLTPAARQIPGEGATARVQVERPGGFSVLRQSVPLNGQRQTATVAADQTIDGVFVVVEANAAAGTDLRRIPAPVVVERLAFGRLGLQGGIVILAAVGGQPVPPGQKVPSAIGPLFTSPGLPAVRVCGNRVVCPQGPALLLTGIGPAVVTDNSFVSTGTYSWPDDLCQPFDRLSSGTPALSASVVAVAPLNPDLAGNLGQVLAADGRLLFANNQVTLALDKSGEAVERACFFHWPRDVSVADNQFVAHLAVRPQAHVWVAVPSRLSTARVVGNRVAEEPSNPEFTSLRVTTVADKSPVIVSLNQTTGVIEIVPGPPVTTTATPFVDGNQRHV